MNTKRENILLEMAAQIAEGMEPSHDAPAKIAQKIRDLKTEKRAKKACDICNVWGHTDDSLCPVAVVARMRGRLGASHSVASPSFASRDALRQGISDWMKVVRGARARIKRGGKKGAVEAIEGHRCPDCKGRKWVAGVFANGTRGWTCENPKPCVGCKGRKFPGRTREERAAEIIGGMPCTECKGKGSTETCGLELREGVA